jgi:type I restriction enzyme R subunit
VSLNEAVVEQAALEWFQQLGYTAAAGPTLAPGEPSAERASFSDVVLQGRLRRAIHRLKSERPRGCP